MFEPTIIIAAASLTGLVIVAAALLRGWQGWLELKPSLPPAQQSCCHDD